jgi:hypothetical protein
MGASTSVINGILFDWPFKILMYLPRLFSIFLYPYRLSGIPPDQLIATRPSSMAYIPHTTIGSVLGLRARYL